MPSEDYPYQWSVCRWLEGENAVSEPITDLHQAAIELARFIAALQAIDPTDGPRPGSHNSFRGVPLASRDAQTRAAISSLKERFDTDELAGAWKIALKTPAWNGPPVWLHGDLHPANLIVKQGTLNAVIDFGCLGVGDPACEFMVARTVLSAETRPIFRSVLQIDKASWTRASGWALSFGLIALPYYGKSNPVLAGIAKRTIDEVLTDYRNGF